MASETSESLVLAKVTAEKFHYIAEAFVAKKYNNCILTSNEKI